MSTQPSPVISIPVLKCMYPNCGNEWVPRTSHMPKVCPKCKRYGWEIGSTRKKKRRGGKHVGTKKTAHLGPETEKFLRQRKET